MAGIISIEEERAVEGGAITSRVRLSEPPADAVRVDWRAFGGTALVGAGRNEVDAGASGGSALPLSGTLVFAPGQQVQNINLVVRNDDLDELDESFFVELSNAVGASFGGTNQSLQALGWALDDPADGLGLNAPWPSPTPSWWRAG